MIFVVHRVRGWFTNNYFDGAEIAKVEVFLLIAVVAVFLPFLYADLGERFTRSVWWFDDSLSDEQIKKITEEARVLRKNIQKGIDNLNRLTPEELNIIFRVKAEELDEALKIIEEMRKNPSQKFLRETEFTI